MLSQGGRRDREASVNLDTYRSSQLYRSRGFHCDNNTRLSNKIGPLGKRVKIGVHLQELSQNFWTTPYVMYQQNVTCKTYALSPHKFTLSAPPNSAPFGLSAKLSPTCWRNLNSSILPRNATQSTVMRLYVCLSVSLPCLSV